MLPYRLAAFDMDGTLLDSTGAIRPDTFEAIAKLRALGVACYLVTGRHHSGVRYFHHQLGLDTPAICCNGTYVYDFAQNKVLAASPMQRASAHAVLEWAHKEGVHALLYADDTMFYNVYNDNLRTFEQKATLLPEGMRAQVKEARNGSLADEADAAENIWKVLITAENTPAMNDSLARLSEQHAISYEWSWRNKVDIQPKGNSKGNRLEEIVEGLGIDLDDVMAFGDQMNDISMLSIVGMSVGMGNAHPSVLPHSIYLTRSNDEGGISHAIDMLIRVNSEKQYS